jgi:hypothetical protein
VTIWYTVPFRIVELEKVRIATTARGGWHETFCFLHRIQTDFGPYQLHIRCVWGAAVGAWNWPFYSTSKECMELYLHTTISFHCVMLTWTQGQPRLCEQSGLSPGRRVWPNLPLARTMGSTALWDWGGGSYHSSGYASHLYFEGAWFESGLEYRPLWLNILVIFLSLASKCLA